MLSNQQGKKIREKVDDYVVFDLETTGISNKTDAIIEISAVKIRAGKQIGEFSSLVNPLRPIPMAASRVNGITDDMVKDSPLIQDVLTEFIDFIADDVLIGHNIYSFDLKFIYRDLREFFGKIIDNDFIDTLPLSREKLKDIPHHKLTDLAEYYGISSEGAHRALNDCVMNYKVYECLKDA